MPKWKWSFLTTAKEYIPEERLEVVKDAYEFAKKAHDGQVRRSGEPFIEHPLETARFLAELRLDPNTLAAALLHDVVEDCDDIEIEDIKQRFGEEIAILVDGVTKLTEAEALAEARVDGQRLLPADDLSQAATIRKMLVSMAEDIRVVLIKLSDRLHNMRTLQALPEERRVAIAQETLDIYAPLAHRLGIWEIKWLLEDLSFQYLNTDAYKEVSKLISSTRQDREEYTEQARGILQSELEKVGIAAEVTGRPKHLYSIHKKIQKYAEQNMGVDEIYDLFALRVLVNEVNDCYAALGVVHSKWRPLPGQFDDYIANPKDNLYRSLHTSVLCIDAQHI